MLGVKVFSLTTRTVRLRKLTKNLEMSKTNSQQATDNEKNGSKPK